MTILIINMTLFTYASITTNFMPISALGFVPTIVLSSRLRILCLLCYSILLCRGLHLGLLIVVAYPAPVLVDSNVSIALCSRFVLVQ